MLTLAINLKAEAVSTLTGAGYQIVLLADTRPAALIVACLLPPLQSQSVSWDPAARVYTSVQAFKQGGVIAVNSSVSASMGTLYDYQGGQITAIGTSKDPASIQLTNSSGATVTGGLASAFSIDQASGPDPVAVTGAPILSNGQGTFAASNDYLISAATGVQVGQIVAASDFASLEKSITPISALSLTLLPFASQQVNNLTVEFNSTTNQFETPT